jgi:hypothetical protein
VNLIRLTVESTESVKSSIFTFSTIKLGAANSNALSDRQRRDLAILLEDYKKTLRTVNVAFVAGREAILTHEIDQEKNSSSIKNLLKKFRNHLCTVRALTSLMADVGGQGIFASDGLFAPKAGSGPNKGLAEMIDQGNLDQTNEDGKSEIPLCLCETDHRFSECSYIRRSIRLSE